MRYKPIGNEGDCWTACMHCVIGPRGSNTCSHGKHSDQYDIDRRGCWGGKIKNATNLNRR